jgi:hypothetical protein
MSFQLRGVHQKSLGERKVEMGGLDWCWDEARVPKGRTCHLREAHLPNIASWVRF